MPVRRDGGARRRPARLARPSFEAHDRDRVALVAAAGCLGFSWLIWLAGGLLAFMATGRWREVPVTQAPVLLMRLMVHLNTPREAWPPLVRRSLPGSGVTDAWLVVLALLAGVAVLWLAWHRSDGWRFQGAPGRGPGPGREASRSAGARRLHHSIGLDRLAASRSPSRTRGWAHQRDLRPLRVPKATGDRIVLGTHAGRLLAADVTKRKD